MRFQTTTRPLRDLVREFNSGGILLPQFQRDYVWRPAKIRNLLDSLLRGYPIGGIYLWRPIAGTLDAKPKSLGKHRIAPRFEGYLIDGQQRLTSLEAAFGLYAGEDRGSELRCYLDLNANQEDGVRDTRLFVTRGNRSVARRVESGDSTLVPVSALFDGADYELRRSTEEALRLIPGWNAERVETALRRLDQAAAMLDQQVPCTTISDVEDKEAVEVFARLNRGGTALSQGDARAAELARGRAVNVLKEMRGFVARERATRLGFGFSFAFRALVLFHRGAAQFGSLKPNWMDEPGLRHRNLADSWTSAQRAIDAALALVDKMGWSRRSLVPSMSAVIVLAAALDQGELHPSEADQQNYRKFLCVTALRNVFQASVETKINRFHRAIRGARTRVADALVGALTREEGRRIRADELDDWAQPWSATTLVMHAWLVGEKAKDWLSGEPLDALARSGRSVPAGDLTVHHLFSRRQLADVGRDPDDANCPANYVLVSKATNAELGGKSPEEVLAKLGAEQRRYASAQFFGEDAGERLRIGKYDEFCRWRAEQMAGALNEWLGIE